MTAAAKNTVYIDLMRESCEDVARQKEDKERREEKRRGQYIIKISPLHFPMTVFYTVYALKLNFLLSCIIFLFLNEDKL